MSIANTWLAEMWTACLQGGILILACWALTRAIPGTNPRLRQALWWLACLKLLVGFLWVRPFELYILPAQTPKVHQVLEALSPAAWAGGIPGAASEQGSRWPALILALWLVGVLVCLAGLASGALRSWKLTRDARPLDEEPARSEAVMLAATMGLHSSPRLLVSGAVGSPCVVGIIRPALVVPEEFSSAMSAEELRMAVAHELAHLRRRDLLLAVVPSLAFALFYFFPPVWLACREWATDREAACDREALDATRSQPKAYGAMLLKVVAADRRRAVPGMGATAQFHTLRRRLQLVGQGSSKPWATVMGFALLAVSALAMVPWRLVAVTPRNGLLRNSGFEFGGRDPEGWTAEASLSDFKLAWDHQVSHNGNASIYISRTSQRYWPIAQWSQEIPYDGRAASMAFGAWIKADKVAKAVLDVQFEDATGQGSHAWVAYIGSVDPASGLITHDWAQYSGVVNIPPGTVRVHVALQDYGPGAIWMDDAFAYFSTGSER